jgi:hypothetical protein
MMVNAAIDIWENYSMVVNIFASQSCLKYFPVAGGFWIAMCLQYHFAFQFKHEGQKVMAGND